MTPCSRRSNDQVFEVVEEDLDVATRQIERGRMRIYSKISERVVACQIRLRDETIGVQRRPVSWDVSVSEPALFQECAYESTEVDEEAVVHIRARVIEEVVSSIARSQCVKGYFVPVVS